MANKLHIKKGDNVRVLSGVYRGQEGQILKIYPKTQRAIVEGINLISKHVRPSQQNPDGGIIEQEGTIHISNLMVIIFTEFSFKYFCTKCNLSQK